MPETGGARKLRRKAQGRGKRGGVDRYEAMLWFRSRGDECLNCGASGSLLMMGIPLVIRIHK